MRHHPLPLPVRTRSLCRYGDSAGRGFGHGRPRRGFGNEPESAALTFVLRFGLLVLTELRLLPAFRPTLTECASAASNPTRPIFQAAAKSLFSFVPHAGQVQDRTDIDVGPVSPPQCGQVRVVRYSFTASTLLGVTDRRARSSRIRTNIEMECWASRRFPVRSRAAWPLARFAPVSLNAFARRSRAIAFFSGLMPRQFPTNTWSNSPNSERACLL